VIRVLTFRKDFDTKEDAILFSQSSASLGGAAALLERTAIRNRAGTHGRRGRID
jgi:hypothetical protein